MRVCVNDHSLPPQQRNLTKQKISHACTTRSHTSERFALDPSDPSGLNSGRQCYTQERMPPLMGIDHRLTHLPRNWTRHVPVPAVPHHSTHVNDILCNLQLQATPITAPKDARSAEWQSNPDDMHANECKPAKNVDRIAAHSKRAKLRGRPCVQACFVVHTLCRRREGGGQLLAMAGRDFGNRRTQDQVRDQVRARCAYITNITCSFYNVVVRK